MSNDMTLLREYARGNSEAAFTTLVSRHIDLVYSVAWRRVRDPHLAEEITQAVFILLARKAESLGPKIILPGWLCRTARYASANALTMQRRRQQREQEAYMQSVLNEPEAAAWSQIAPLLDTALAQLGEKDHDAVVLRFFNGKSFKEVGAALGASEDTAKKRVSRAVEKLRGFFTKRGVVLSGAALAGAISAHSVQAAPATLAKSVTAVAMAKGAAASSSTLTLIKGALKLMAWSKAKIAVVATVGVLLAAGTTTMVVTKARASSLDAYLRDPELTAISNAPPMVAVQLSHFAKGTVPYGTILGKTDGTREIGRSMSLSGAILKAYRAPSFVRMVFPEELHRVKVDYLVTVPDQPYEKFQEEIKRKFGWAAHLETRETDVLLLKVNHRNAPGLTPADNTSWAEWYAQHGRKFGIDRHNITLADFAQLMEGLTTKPVIDRTGLTGNYDFVTGAFGTEEMNQVFIDDLGLELVPGREPVEMLVVEK